MVHDGSWTKLIFYPLYLVKKALMIGRYAFLVLNLCLHIVDDVILLADKSDFLAGERSDAEMTGSPSSVVRGLHEFHRSAAARNCLRSARCSSVLVGLNEDRVHVQRFYGIR